MRLVSDCLSGGPAGGVCGGVRLYRVCYQEGEGMSRSLQRALQVASDRIVQQEDQIQRALQVLHKAQRYALENAGEMEACSQGDWIPIDDVVKAIQILREGQQ